MQAGFNCLWINENEYSTEKICQPSICTSVIVSLLCLAISVWFGNFLNYHAVRKLSVPTVDCLGNFFELPSKISTIVNNEGLFIWKINCSIVCVFRLIILKKYYNKNMNGLIVLKFRICTELVCMWLFCLSSKITTHNSKILWLFVCKVHCPSICVSRSVILKVITIN